MVDTWYLDYANGWPPAAEALRLGYKGTIRYVTSPGLMQPPNPGNRKHITKAEYDSHQLAGLDVWLVYQGSTSDADTGFAGGRQNALRAVEGTLNRTHPSGRVGPLGYMGPIFFCNDRPALPDPAAWRAYLDGAASVLGIARVGAYGFANAMDAAVGHATWFWQAGRRSDVRKHVHFWQDNTGFVTVSGVQCDRNLVVGNIDRGQEQDVDLNDKMRPFIWPHNDTVQDTVGSTLANTQSYAADLAKNKVPTIIELLQDIQERVTALEAKPTAVADVDEAQLAAELEARGIGGVTAAEFKDILSTVRLTPGA